MKISNMFSQKLEELIKYNKKMQENYLVFHYFIGQAPCG